MPLSWKTLISNYSDTDEEDLCQNHHANKGARILSTDELSSKEIHSILISNIVNTNLSQTSISKDCFKIQL